MSPIKSVLYETYQPGNCKRDLLMEPHQEIYGTSMVQPLEPSLIG